MSPTDLKFHTPLSPEQCRSRLEASVDIQKLAFTRSGYAGTRDIIAKFSSSSFRLQKRRNHRNSFAPFFYGRFIPMDNGTRVEGEFRMHPFTRGFMVFWFGFLFLFTTLAFVFPANTHPGHEHDRFMLLFMPALMAAFGVALVRGGNWLARKEQTAIVEFLRKTLEAKDSNQI
jgi:hypothetical protein